MLRNELLIYFPQKEFFSGDEVKGYAELRLPFPLKLFGVKMEVFGREISDVSGYKKEINNFITMSSILPGPGSKDRGKTLFGKPNKKMEQIPAGVHQYPFVFILPDHMPPSYSSAHGQVEYEIRITVEAADKGMSDLISSAKLPVGGSLFDMNFLGNKSTPIQLKESKSFLLSKGTLDITTALDSQVFLSGDSIKARFTISNTTSKKISNVTAKLLQKIDVYNGSKLAKSEEFQLCSHSLGDIESKQQLHPSVDLIIPTTCPESVFQKTTAVGGKVGKLITISYEVFLYGEVTLGNDLKLSIPIYVVRRTRHQQLVQQATQQQQVPPPQQGVVSQVPLQPQVPLQQPQVPQVPLQQQPQQLPPPPVKTEVMVQQETFYPQIALQGNEYDFNYASQQQPPQQPTYDQFFQ